MNSFWLCAAFLGVCAVAAVPDSARAQSVPTDTSTAPAAPVVDSLADSASVRNPVVASLLSVAVPGAGQVYNHQFFKGIAFAGAEAGLIAAAITRYQESFKYDKAITRDHAVIDPLTGGDGRLLAEAYVLDSTRIDTLRDSSGSFLGLDTLEFYRDTATIYRMSLDTSLFKREQYRRGMSNAITWSAGVYLWALLDAVEKTGYFKNDEPRNPRLAGWLSAVPGLGLGQLYNGRLGKAGMVIAVQSALGVMAYNYHMEYTQCVDELRRIVDTRSEEHRLDAGGVFYDEWNGMRKDAFRQRNTYLWYSLFFYLYGVFDAVVDAHLHDFQRRIRLEPDLLVPEKQIGLSLRFGG